MKFSANPDGSSKYPGKPLTIFNFDLTDHNDNQNETITFDNEELEKILTHKEVKTRKVVVVSIIGAFRKGKSFILDYFLRFMYTKYKSVESSKPFRRNQNHWLGDRDEILTGFSWKGGAKRNTTGIIIWSDVFLYDDPNGDKLAILLMDTQGLFDHESSPTDNSRIFSLSTLISSMQIFNLFNNIQEDHLQYLQFATEFAQFVTDGAESGKPFQNLLFLIRDWGAADDYPYGINGGKDLLAQVLEVNKKQKPELRSLREYIFKSFDKISCFLMPHPGPIVASKKDYDGRWAQIDPEFMDYMKDLVETLLAPENIIIKKINHENLTAGDLYTYICQYVKMYKSEDLPKVQSIYEATVSNNLQILISKSFLVYTETVQLEQQYLEVEKDIDPLHERAIIKALEVFDGVRKMGTQEHGDTARCELCEKMNRNLEVWKISALAQIANIEEHKKKLAKLEKARLKAERGGCMKACGCGAVTAISALMCCLCKR